MRLLRYIVFVLTYLISVNVVLSINSVNDLNPSERKWVNWIKKWTVPNTMSSGGLQWDNSLWLNVVNDPNISPSAYAAAVGTWWSLSEDIFNEPYSTFSSLGVPQVDGYLFNYNLCSEMVNGTPKSNFMIAPNEVCNEDAPQCGSCWQNGIFGMEMGHTSALNVAVAAENIYKGKTYWTVIKNTMGLAGFGPGSNVYNTLLKCFPNDQSFPAAELSVECADLVKIWLVRNHLVALSVAVSDNLGCLSNSSNYPVFCMNPSQKMRFSNGFKGVKNTINILAQYFAH